MEIKLSIETVNKVLAYLGTRPYQEVFQTIDAIQSEAERQLKGAKNGGEMDTEGNQ